MLFFIRRHQKRRSSVHSELQAPLRPATPCV